MVKLAIEMGTSLTKIYRVGEGAVLSEATALSISRETKEIRAYGDEAKRLLGKTAELTDIVFPVWEGEIRDERYAGILLEYFVKKVVPRRPVTGIEVLFCVPCACSLEERRKYYRVAKAAGISRVNFAETPYLAAIGQDFPLSESNPVFAMDVGAGKTSLAVLSLDGIIAGLTMCVGGNNMDSRIIDQIVDVFNLKIGLLTAEKLKSTVGSLYQDDNQSMPVNGQDNGTGRPRTVTISSQEILYPIRFFVDKILEYADLLLRKLPAEVSATMSRNGIYLSGGVCALAGFADHISENLHMEVHCRNDVETAVILGGGRVIASPALMRKVCMPS